MYTETIATGTRTHRPETIARTAVAQGRALPLTEDGNYVHTKKVVVCRHLNSNLKNFAGKPLGFDVLAYPMGQYYVSDQGAQIHADKAKPYGECDRAGAGCGNCFNNRTGIA